MDEPHIAISERTDRPIFINSCKFLLIQHYVFTWKSLSCERQEIHCNTVAEQLNAVNGFHETKYELQIMQELDEFVRSNGD